MGTLGIPMTREEGEAILEKVCTILDQFDEILEVVPCGSYRRLQPIIRDLDLVIITHSGEIPEKVKFALTDIDIIPMSMGKKQAMLLDENNRQIDLNSCRPQERGSFILHWTGSAAHNIYLRKLAMKKGLSLSQYGLKSKSTGVVTTGPEEECIFTTLGIEFVPPERRD